MRSLECYFGVYFPRCCATRQINTKITFSWAHKQFATRVHTLFYMYYSHGYPFHAGINNPRNATKLEKPCLRCKTNTWQAEFKYILQPPDYFIIANRLRYINHNVTKDMRSIPMDMAVVLDLHKLSLQVTIDHHEPSMLAIILPLSTVARNIILQWKKSCGIWNDWYQKLLYCICSNLSIDCVMVFGLEQEDVSLVTPMVMVHKRRYDRLR